MFIEKLPVEFLSTIRGMLGEDEKRYLEALGQSRVFGLRANLLKISPEQLREALPFLSHAIPWCPEGYYYMPENRPAKSVWYHAGLFYAQEPSAMLPAAAAGIEPGHLVLDICAAPGGKATQAAGYLRGTGLIVANDVSISRCKPLVKNIELSGVTNAVVVCEKPERLAQRFGQFFDRILVDAPCSGEGMFRKDMEAVLSWSKYKPEACAAVQRDILHHAAVMLKPGGRLVYSTCTFEPCENEGMVEWFLNTHEGFSVIPLDIDRLGITGSAFGSGRIWPHLQEGEGHYVCVLRKDKGSRAAVSYKRQVKRIYGIEYFYAFCEEYLSHEIAGNVIAAGESLYRVPYGIPDLSGIRTVRSGWYLGELKNKRFEPSQAFAMGLKMNCARNVINFRKNSDKAERYLKGESFDVQACGGWALVCAEGYPLGWAKVRDGWMKNKYLKSWVMG